MHKAGKDCLQQVRFVEWRHARATDQFVAIDKQKVGRVGRVKSVNLAPIGTADRLPAVDVDENRVPQAVMAFQKVNRIAVRRCADWITFIASAPKREMKLQ